MITANELKTKDIKAIEENLSEYNEVGITVRGTAKYVVMTLAQYEKMRAIELDAAYLEVMKDIEKDDYIVESADEHIARFSNNRPKKNAKVHNN
jgi:hypothetical protein